MALTNRTVTDWADYLYDRVGYAGDDSAVYTLRDGRTIKLEIVPDDVERLDDFGDCYGQVELDRPDRYTGYSKRPDGFNGAARKFSGNGRSNDTFWWQPPSDLLNDEDNLGKLFEIVRGYYNGDWYYVGLVVQIDNACFKCGKMSNAGMASLWGIESNSDDDFFKATIAELIWEAWSDR